MFDFSKWRKSRKIANAREQYRYSLLKYANRHKPDRSSEDAFLIGGLILYIALPVIGVMTGQAWLGVVAVFAFMGAVLLPFGASALESYRLAKKTTITMNVVRDNPEDKRPLRIRLQGVEWGAKMETDDELLSYLQQRNGFLSHAVVAKDGEAAKLIQKARNAQMGLYPMMAKGDKVPSLVMLPDAPEKMIHAQEERVRLDFGVGKVRHATIYALEGKPIKTSINIEESIVDVEYAVFLPFFTQEDLEQWLSSGHWFIPTPIARSVAEYTKKKTDDQRNASTFATLEKERDDASAAYRRLLVHQQYQDIQDDIEKGILKKYNPNATNKTDVLMYAVAFALGFFIAMFINGMG